MQLTPPCQWLLAFVWPPYSPFCQLLSAFSWPPSPPFVIDCQHFPHKKTFPPFHRWHNLWTVPNTCVTPYIQYNNFNLNILLNNGTLDLLLWVAPALWGGDRLDALRTYFSCSPLLCSRIESSKTVYLTILVKTLFLVHVEWWRNCRVSRIGRTT